MIDMEFVKSYSVIRSRIFDWLDTQNKERNSIPMEYLLAIFRDMSVKQGVSIYIVNYFIDEWCKLHPEAFDDSNC